MNLDRLNPNRRTRVAPGTTATADTLDPTDRPVGAASRMDGSGTTDTVDAAGTGTSHPAHRATDPVDAPESTADPVTTARPVVTTRPVTTTTRPVTTSRGSTAVDDAGVADDEAATDEPTGPAVAEPVVLDRATVVAREKEAFGGVKIGSAFFGWLTATGSALLLTAFVAAGGTAVGVLNGDSVSNPDFGVTWRGTRGAIVIIAILFIAYFAGGYVTGRMARFNGISQGLAVFAWAIVVAVLVAAVGALAGTQWDALKAVTGVPRFSTGPAHVTADGLLVGLLAVVGALVGSVVGGLTGMRFHRRVDRAGLGR